MTPPLFGPLSYPRRDYSRRRRAPPEHDFPKSTQTFFVKENGIDLAITNAIEAIVSCLRSEDQFCVNVPDEGMNLRSLGM